MRILAGDVGGTKTNLVLAEFPLVSPPGAPPTILAEGSLVSARYSGLEAALDDFGAELHGLAAACFGVAGAVHGGRSTLTNLGWRLDEATLGAKLGCGVRLLNDLEANAYGLATLGSDELVALQGEAPPPAGSAALISAGTGLGMALLPYVGGSHHPQPTESGHTTFAPQGEVEVELHAFLRQRFGRPTWEHVLSGPGMGNLYDFFRTRQGLETHPAVAAARAGEGTEDANGAIARLGAAGEDHACAAALELFGSLYGSEAGNLALRTLPRGGLFVGGGIAPKILPTLRAGGFLESYRDKAPFRELLESFPVYVVTDDRTALKGALRVGRILAGEH